MAIIRKEITGVGEDVAKSEPSRTGWWERRVVQPLGNQPGSPSTELPYDPAIPLLRMYPRAKKTHVHVKVGHK